MTRKITACVFAIVVAGFVATATAQEPEEPVESGEFEFGDIPEDIRTFGGPLHRGFYPVPGNGIQEFIELYHYEAGTAPAV